MSGQERVGGVRAAVLGVDVAGLLRELVVRRASIRLRRLEEVRPRGASNGREFGGDDSASER